MVNESIPVKWENPCLVIACYADVIYFDKPSMNIMNCAITVNLHTNYVFSLPFLRELEIREKIHTIVKDWDIILQERTCIWTQEYRIELYSPRQTIACLAFIEIEDQRWKAWVIKMVNGQIFVNFDRNFLPIDDSLKKKKIQKILIHDFKKKFNSFPQQQIIDIDNDSIKPIVVFHDEEKENGMCFADLIYADGTEEYNFKILYFGKNNIAVYQNNDEDGKNILVKGVLHKYIRDAFFSHFDEKIFKVYRASSQNIENMDCTKYGRIKNAVSDSFIMFRPNQILREEHILGNREKVVKPISRMQQISIFEIDMLSWVNELRYTTSDMLTDLVEAGLISSEGQNFQKTKLSKKMSNLSQYCIVDISQFATIDNNGRLIEKQNTRSIARIYTLGPRGANMLAELGRGYHYNPFERFQDGNIVKAILAVNQWLVYWLAAYPNEFIDHYQSSRIVYIRDSQINGARFHASIERDDCIVIGEPIRRTDQVEKRKRLIDKFKRFMDIFTADSSTLYCSYNEVILPVHKILCYICEDEEHIDEVHEIITPYLSEFPNQEIWYTTDLKMHNYNEEGKRFIIYKDNKKKEYVEIERRLSLGKERMWQYGSNDN